MRARNQLLAVLLAATAAAQEGDARVPLLPHQDLQLALRRLETGHSDIVDRLLVGESRSGRAIEALRLAAGELTAGRPGILVVGGLEGREVWTSGLVLALAQGLAKDYATDEDVRALLDTTTVYLVPRANPDACEARFQSPLREPVGTGPGGDEDQDGRSGEDGPRDVNGDGVVSWMRVPDPEGTWRPDDVDPRVLVEAEGIERGRWRRVPEGVDADGDGRVAEDPPLDARVDRNFPAGFREHDASAGPFPTSEPEARALCDLVIARKDLQVVVVYGGLDTVSEPPEGVDDDAPDDRRVPVPGVRRSDARFLADLARRYRELTGDEAPGDRKDDAGSFARWCYEHRSLWTLAIDPWSIPVKEGEGEEGEDGARASADARRLAWLEARGVDAHLGWSSFEHPDLGEVEVGGFRPYALTEPPAAVRETLVDWQRAFLVSLRPDLSRLELAEATWKPLGDDLVEVRATVENRGRLPILGVWGRRTRTTRPARIELVLPEGARRLAGPSFELVDELEGGGRHELRWIVADVDGRPVGVRIDSDHAGTARATCEEVPR